MGKIIYNLRENRQGEVVSKENRAYDRFGRIAETAAGFGSRVTYAYDPKGSVAERRNLRLKPALQAQPKSAIIPTTSKKASSAQGYATSVALATGWRGRNGAVMKMFYVLALLLCLPLAANAADFTIENALDAFWRHVRAEGGEKLCDDGFEPDDEPDDDDGFSQSNKNEKPSVEGVLSVDFDGDRRLWRIEHWSLLKIGKLVKRDETSTNISPVYTNLVVASAVDSTGKVVELSSRYVAEPPIDGLPFKSLVSFCKAKGINLATVSAMRSGGSGSETETGVVRYGGTTLCVTKKDVMKAEKDAFLAAISDADRVVVRNGGYNCCNKDVDNDNVVLTITNAADIAAFNRMFQLKDKGNSGCFCCGFPGVDWWRAGQRVALTGVQHGKAIRWRGFSFGDRLLTDESARELEAWLSRHSLDEAAAKRQSATAETRRK